MSWLEMVVILAKMILGTLVFGYHSTNHMAKTKNVQD